MENFTNQTIDTTQLPRFEEVQFSSLHPSYWKVSLIFIAILFLILCTGLGYGVFFEPKIAIYKLELSILLITFIILVIVFSRIGFLKKGFAFRNHDVLYRIQHVALHEGMISRFFGLAKIEIFTAGGDSSDIEIPGILKEHAENIKQLLMGKIQKEL
jgi:membrane protein YdbS with pleckstrin-like domain